MGKALFLASKTLGDPSALRPQGDKKRGLRATWWGVVLSEAKDLRGSVSPEGPQGRPFAAPSLRSGLRLGATRS